MGPPVSLLCRTLNFNRRLVQCLESVVIPRDLHAPKPAPIPCPLFLPYFPHNMSENTQRPKMRCTCIPYCAATYTESKMVDMTGSRYRAT
ncbi:uncharacterized protein CTRU02_212714 [Colletotrichum truncatum]|uniref:Uncharacterized protein n=1 Tax=Colletotrichum truncatum TaxID=5467 RepID=A0ACC3YJ80_COLTU|nr:uncharacterized protein CTRU02_05209 [Colletotrichum truncatum]KAF6794377.1 hypothetical protein CTRU02_05209 [Colletotrichum truncatum]